MSEMVERAAAAIGAKAAENNCRISVVERWLSVPHLCISDEHGDTYIPLAALAVAAIEAMREPTEAMIVGGVTTDVETARTAEGDGRCLTPGLIWRSMIDGALK